MTTRAKQPTRPFTLIHNADSGGCGSYRILWPTAALFAQKKLRGAVSDRLLGEQELKAMAPEVCILQRQYYDYQIKSLRTYRKHIPFIVYELDDILDKVPNWSIHKHQMPENIRKQLKTCFSLVDRVTTTTPFLAEELRRFSKDVDIRVVPNFLPPVWKTLKPYKPQERMRIGWAGALAHKHDLALLEPVMKHFGNKVDWVFMGLTPEKVPEGVNIQVVNGVALQDYPMVLNSLNLDVGVVPLEVNTLNRAKSGIRVMELGINGCAIVATDLEPYQGFKNIVRVRNEIDQWIDALEFYVNNRQMAWKEGAALREEVLANHMLDDHADQFASAWGGDVYEPIAPRSSNKTTIVIPVQKDADATRACLTSVVASLPENKTETEIVVVQDNAEAAVKGVVGEFTRHISDVIDHQTIKGFSGSVNDGIKASTGDVLLLNSDCVVYGDWLDRMHKALKVAPNIASVTPIGTDESFVSVNLPDVPVPRLDAIAREMYADSGTEIGTPVGFCMLLRREALREIGLFDNKAFPRIYGEENDWGSAALLYQWKHMLCASTVVGHIGNRSVQNDQNKQLRQQGLNTVLLRYSFYQKLMQNIESIPLRQFKSGLEMKALASGKPSIVLISHTAGGGVETYTQRIGASIMNEGWDTYVVRTNSQNPMFCSFTRGGKDYKYPELISLNDGAGLENFMKVLKRINCKLLLVNTLVNYPSWMDKFIMTASKETGIPYDVVIHDMFYWCPQLNMVRKNTKSMMAEKFCNSKSESECRDCTARGTMFGFADISEWREKYGAFLDGSRYIHTTSSTFIDFLLNYITQSTTWEPSKIKVHAHPEAALTYKQAPGKNIAIIGHNVLPMKGSLYVAQLVKLMPDHKFFVFGNIQPPLAGPNVVLSGPYQHISELKARVAASGCSVALFLSTWPEIHMYALTDALQCGLAPIVFDLGVQAQRMHALREHIPGLGNIISQNLMYNEKMVDALAHEIQTTIHAANTPLYLDKSYDVPAVEYSYITDYFSLANATPERKQLEPSQG